MRNLHLTAEEYKVRNAENQKAWLAARPTYYKEQHQKLRRAAVKFYGEACACCGEDREFFLSIDHIVAGEPKTPKDLYRWLKRNNYPDGFQVLCYNCNHAKGTKERCPCGGERRQEASITSGRSNLYEELGTDF